MKLFIETYDLFYKYLISHYYICQNVGVESLGEAGIPYIEYIDKNDIE